MNKGEGEGVASVRYYRHVACLFSSLFFSHVVVVTFLSTSNFASALFSNIMSVEKRKYNTSLKRIPKVLKTFTDSWKQESESVDHFQMILKNLVFTQNALAMKVLKESVGDRAQLFKI